MFKWKKLGLVFSPQEHNCPEWMQEFAQAPSVVIFEHFLRVYFSCRPMPDSKGQYISYSGFVDLNKNNFFEILRIAKKPILKLGELGCFDEFGTYPVSVIKFNNEYRVYYAGWTRCFSVPFNVAIGYGVSNDEGETFSKIGNGPVLSYSPDEPFILSGPKIRKFADKWALFYISGSKWVSDNGKPEPSYKIRVAFSDDGFSWNKLNKNLIESRLEIDEAQASPDVFFKDGLYHMFFCYRYSKNFRNQSFGYRIGYASSIDLINWERDDSKAGIDISEEGWDAESISYPHVFELNGEFYMFYLGNNVGKYGFGLAQLEK